MIPGKEISDLRGVIVVAREEGAILGSVTQIFVKPSTRQIAALSFRKRLGSKESLVERKHVETIGRDVVLITKEGAAKPLVQQDIAELRSLKELQGTWVTTLEGEHLGTLVDLEIERKDWTVVELRLADGKKLRLDDVKDLTLGRDQILVPATYAAKVTKPKKDEQNGFLGRVFGSESVEDVKNTITRTLKGAARLSKPADKKKPAKDNGAPAKDKGKKKAAPKRGAASA